MTGRDGNTAIGFDALGKANGARNIAVGNAAGANLTTGSDNIEIGHRGVAGEAKTIRIGTQGTQTATFLAGVNGVTIPGPAARVFVNAQGRLGTVVAPAAVTSSRTGSGSEGRLAKLVHRQQRALSRQQRQLDELRREIAAMRG